MLASLHPCKHPSIRQPLARPPHPGHPALIVCRSGVSACQGRIAAGQTAVRVGERGDPGREKREHPKGTVGNPGWGGNVPRKVPQALKGAGRASGANFPEGGAAGGGGAGGRRRESGAEGGSHFKGSFLPIMLCGDVDKWIQDGVESNDR